MVELTWLWISFASGIFMYIGAPWLVAPYLPDDYQLKIGRFYYWLSATSLWRPKIVRRLLGGYTLVKSSFDAEKQGEKVSLDGEERHHTDPLGVVSRWQNKHFALALEGFIPFFSIKHAEYGAALRTHARNDAHITTHTVETDGGKRTRHRVNPFVEIPKSLQVVDLADAVGIAPRDADPTDPATAADYTKAAWAKYSDAIGTTEAFAVLMGFAAGFAAVGVSYLYLVDLGSGAGAPEPGGPIIPLGWIHVPVADLLLLLGGLL